MSSEHFYCYIIIGIVLALLALCYIIRLICCIKNKIYESRGSESKDVFRIKCLCMKMCKNIKFIDEYFKKFEIKDLQKELYFLPDSDVDLYYAVIHRDKGESIDDICYKFKYSREQFFRIRKKILKKAKDNIK